MFVRMDTLTCTCFQVLKLMDVTIPQRHHQQVSWMLEWLFSHEVIVAVKCIQVRLVKHFKLDPVLHEASNTTKALAKLVAFLLPVGNELKLCTEILVVLNNPLNECHMVYHFQFYS